MIDLWISPRKKKCCCKFCHVTSWRSL